MSVCMSTPYTVACAAIHARTSPTFQAVIRLPNLVGSGNLPSRTQRQNVAGLTGNGTGRVGCLGSRTKSDCRTHPLSGRSSKLGMAPVRRAVTTSGIAARTCFLLALAACAVLFIFWYSVEAQRAAMACGCMWCDCFLRLRRAMLPNKPIDSNPTRRLFLRFGEMK